MNNVRGSEYKPNPIPDNGQVELSLTMKQVRMLLDLVCLEIDEQENFGSQGSSFNKRDLTRLADGLWDVAYIKKTEEERQAEIQAWQQDIACKEHKKFFGRQS